MIRFDEVNGDPKSQHLFINWSTESWISSLKKGVSSFVVVAGTVNRSESGFADSFLWSSGLFSFLQKRISEESTAIDISSDLTSLLIQNRILHVSCSVETRIWISFLPLIYP